MMVQRYVAEDVFDVFESTTGNFVKYEDYQELEAENARLRQQRDAANAQLDFILENKE
ncbi:MAG: hypothetical protein ACRCZO_16105 [Cetobacterium sp.]